jgi:hypothetical protein
VLDGAAMGVFMALGCRSVAQPPAVSADHDVLDEALARIAPTGPEYAGRLANHAPMAVEVLVMLGHGDAVARWIDRYVPRLERWPSSVGRIARDDWAGALGRGDRSSDWRAYFVEALREASWRDVVAKWTARLAPGISGSAAHGLIRASHAVRSLAARETEERKGELASALAYWAASFHRLPERAGARARLTVEQALERVELVPERLRVGGPIVKRLDPLNDVPSFADVSDLVDFGGEPSSAVSSLTRAFAAVYLANAAQPDGSIARLHQLTGTSAVRPLLPYLPPETARTLLRYVWQLDAAVYATNTASGATRPAIEPFPTRDDLVAAAVDGGDEHAIKLTEVALREHAVVPDPAYLLAAAHFVRAA